MGKTPRTRELELLMQMCDIIFRTKSNVLNIQERGVQDDCTIRLVATICVRVRYFTFRCTIPFRGLSRTKIQQPSIFNSLKTIATLTCYIMRQAKIRCPVATFHLVQ